MKKLHYYVRCGREWILCKKARETVKGWLEYELHDCTMGLTQPGKWKKE